MDHIEARTEMIADNAAGKYIVLPSKHHGSPRNMLAHYQDAMAMVTQLGAPG